MQQLTLSDFLNLPHFGHAILLPEVMANVLVLTGVVIGEPTMSSRSGIGRCDTYGRVVCVHAVRDIDPDDPANINSLLAFDWAQADPQSVCLNDIAS